MNKKQLRKKLALMLATLKKKRKYYCEVEYLESTGTQWIDTGFTCEQSDDFTIIENVEWTSWTNGFSSNWNAVEGETGIAQQLFFGPKGKNTTNQFYYGIENGGVTYTESTYTGLNERHIYELTRSEGKSIIKKDGVELYNGIKTGPTIKNYRLFCCILHENDAPYSYNFMRNYGTKIIKNGSLFRDFIPVLDWDMKPCMYDKVSGELFYNKATSGDDFSYGRQVHQVEYLESTGTQYINTGIIGTNENIGIDVDWAFSNNNANMCIFSSRSGQTSNTLTLFWLKTVSNRMRFDGRGQTYFTEGVNASVSDDMFNFNYKSTTGAVATLTNKTTGQVQTYTIGKLETFSTNPLYLFCSKDMGAIYSWIKMYGCKIYDGDALVRDYIPAIDENGVGYMFDRVTHTIYDNAGTGDGFKYPPVELEYLESTGTQYIDTGIKPTDDYGYKIRNTYTRGSGEQCAIGCMEGSNRFVGVYTSGSANQLSGAWGSFVNFLPSYPWDTGDILDVEVNYKNSRKMIVGGTELKDISDIHISGTISNTLYLFARHYGTNVTKMYGRIYEAEITKGSDVVAHFIPAFKDGQSGLLNKVDGTFFPNSGTGKFLTGKIIEVRYE